MLQPSIMPDEIALGYLGRVKRLNGLSNTLDAMIRLRQQTQSDIGNGRSVPTAMVLSRIADTTFDELLWHHTLLPLSRGVLPSRAPKNHGDPSAPGILWTVPLRTMRTGAFFCGQCVIEDLDFHGESYWRRSHQVPGAYWCAKHRNALSVSTERHAFDRAPSEFLETCPVVDRSWVANLIESQSIHRFLNICDDLLDRRTPLSEFAVNRALSKRARRLRIHTGRGKQLNGDLLSDRLIDSFDARWLNGILPVLENKRHGERVDKIDLRLQNKGTGLSTVAYSVLLSALYDSAEEALRDVADTADESPTANRAPIGDTVVDGERIRRAYVQHSGCVRSVASALGVTRWTANRQLLEYGLPNFSRRKQPVQSALYLFLVEGVPLSEAVKQCDAPREHVERVLRAAAPALSKAIADIAQVSQKPQRRGNQRINAAMPPLELATS